MDNSTAHHGVRGSQASFMRLSLTAAALLPAAATAVRAHSPAPPALPAALALQPKPPHIRTLANVGSKVAPRAFNDFLWTAQFL